MRATYSASTLGMHHMSFCQGLRWFSAKHRRTVSRDRLQRVACRRHDARTEPRKTTISAEIGRTLISRGAGVLAGSTDASGFVLVNRPRDWTPSLCSPQTIMFIRASADVVTIGGGQIVRFRPLFLALRPPLLPRCGSR